MSLQQPFGKKLNVNSYICSYEHDIYMVSRNGYDVGDPSKSIVSGEHGHSVVGTTKNAYHAVLNRFVVAFMTLN